MISRAKIAVMLLICLVPTGRVARAGFLLVSDTAADVIYRYDDAGQRSVFATEATGSAPRGIVADSAGNVYVANFGSNTIEKFSSTGKDLGVFASANLVQPETLVFDSAGHLDVTSLNNGSIVQFSADGSTSKVLYSGLNRPVGLAFSPSNGGVLFVGTGSTVSEYSASGSGLITTFGGSGLSNANGVTVDAAGNIYVANSGAGTVRKFNSSLSNLGDIVTGLSTGYNVVIDGSGNLDVISFGSHSVHRYSPTGADLGVIDANLAGPTFGTYVQTVPEPASFGMLALGGAIATIAARRGKFGRVAVG